MKVISYNPEKRDVLLKERGIDLYMVACMINDWDILDDLPHPTRKNQRIFIINYNWYPCEVPYVESKNEIFIKTAFLNRKLKKFYSL